MHPNGQLPAYEWDFDDVNPPVHAWAALRVFEIDGERPTHDVPRADLPQAAAQLHLVGQPQGRRGQQRVRGRLPRPRQHRPVRPLGAAARRRPPRAERRHRVDGACTASTCWRSPLRPGRRTTPPTRTCATKFLEHFAYIAVGHPRPAACGTTRTASTTTCCASTRRQPASRCGCGRWSACSRCARSTTLGRATAGPACPSFAGRARAGSSRTSRSSPASVAHAPRPGDGREGRLLALVEPRPAAPASSTACSTRREFLSPHGLRSLSRQPPRAPVHRSTSTAMQPAVDYEPGESTTGLFGGNSNWRGPVWFPVNYLVIEALRRVPPLPRRRASPSSTRPARAAERTLAEVADDLADRLVSIVPATTRDGRRPVLRRLRASSRPTRRWRDLHPVPRVLPRRHRRRPRGLPPDRLDRPRRRPDLAARQTGDGRDEHRHLRRHRDRRRPGRRERRRTLRRRRAVGRHRRAGARRRRVLLLGLHAVEGAAPPRRRRRRRPAGARRRARPSPGRSTSPPPSPAATASPATGTTAASCRGSTDRGIDARAGRGRLAGERTVDGRPTPTATARAPRPPGGPS